MEYTPHLSACPNCKLASLCLPYGLQKQEIAHLSSIVEKKSPLQLDDLLYRQGDACKSLYAIKSGSFKSFITTTEGAEQIIGFYLPGELIGLDSLQHGRFTCSTVALETSSVCELPLARLNDMCIKIPGLQTQMTRILGKEISTVHDNIIMLGHRSAKERIATFLLTLSHRYAALGFSGSNFNLSMRRQDIANFLGLTLETVSRQFAELSKNGVITIKQRDIKINDFRILKAIVEPCSPYAL